MTTRAVAFIATSRPEQALPFYRDVLGLRLIADTPFAIVFDAFGTTLRIQKANAVTRVPYTSFGLDVADVEDAVRRLTARGVTPVRYPHFEQDDLGIWQAPDDGTRVFWFHDPDGNLLSLSQS
jgi:catechol 2,3-dioxygenase-like lactoylglutathione lyase family enzyme